MNNLYRQQKGLHITKVHDYLGDMEFYAKMKERFKNCPVTYKVKPQTWSEILEEKIRVNSL